jgi:hypothetical protein
MTEERIYGLGALDDVPDERDYPVEALYAAEGLAPTAPDALPSFWKAPGMGPVLDQGNTPHCVAYSSSAMKTWQDKRDQLQTFDFDEPRFFINIGGTPNGAYVRDAMNELLADGYPVLSSGQPGLHKIAAYYTVPLTVDAIKAAIYDLGPIIISTPWYRSWFHPVAGVLPAPDVKVGGHAIVAYGWSGNRILLRNSWGTDWGLTGDAYIEPYQLTAANGAWKAVDQVVHPIPYNHVVDILARPSLNMRSAPKTSAAKVGSIPRGKDVTTTQLEKYGGKYTSPSGTVRNDWLLVKYGTKRGWIARGFTRLIK